MAHLEVKQIEDDIWTVLLFMVYTLYRTVTRFSSPYVPLYLYLTFVIQPVTFTATTLDSYF